MNSAFHKRRIQSYYLAVVLLALFLSGCGGTRPTVKIGLVAPFEGRYRELGYEVIYAVRLAIQETNASGGVAGYSIELTSLDDSGSPAQAREQATKLATDPQIVVAVGHWLNKTTAGASEVYVQAGLPLIMTTPESTLPGGSVRLAANQAIITDTIEAVANTEAGVGCYCDVLDGVEFVAERREGGGTQLVIGGPLWGLTQFAMLTDSDNIAFVSSVPIATDAAFLTQYQAQAVGASPRMWATLAYDATQVALAAIEADINANGTPSRTGVTATLRSTQLNGLSGPIRFDGTGERIDPPVTVYTWDSDEITPYSTTP